MWERGRGREGGRERGRQVRARALSSERYARSLSLSLLRSYSLLRSHSLILSPSFPLFAVRVFTCRYLVATT